jgi:hypothetical protein
MWLNHFDREEKMKDQRNNKREHNQRYVMMNSEKYGNNFNDVNSIKKDRFINDATQGRYGNSIVSELSEDPGLKVHKMKSRRREKLKKYLHLGKQKDGYSQDKYKLQNGIGASIELTPDYNYGRILDPQKETYHDEILNQIKSNSINRQTNIQIERETDTKNSM